MRNPAIYLFVLFLLASCSGKKTFRIVDGGVWNTTYHITYRADSDLRDSVLLVMKQVEQSLSPFARNSIVSRINDGDEGATADSMFRRVFLESQKVCRNSGGLFDPTVAPLVNLWGFGYREGGSEPTQAKVDSLLESVGIYGCSISPEGKIAKKHPDTEFNFSAITKGYGCDMVGRMLARNGVDDYMVEIGGEIAMAGVSPRGTDWHIMIDTPVECDTVVVHERLTVIAVTDCGVATSGNYRNYKNTPGGKVWHTVSPLTGHPAETDILSATVKAPTCMEADAYATACMAMDSHSAMMMIEAVAGVDVLLVTADTVLTSPGFPTLQ